MCMNSTSKHLLQRGFSLTELVAVIGTAAILAGLLVFVLTHGNTKKPRISDQRAEAQEITCVNNLKQLGLAFRLWPSGQSDKWPMDVPVKYGGTKEFNTGADTFRHFQVMSNELSTPRILACPADTRVAAYNFVQFNNQNVSYFVGLDANEISPQMFLSGDRNISGPTKPENGILKIRPSDKVSWTAEIHNNVGNILCADGSVQPWSNAGLQKGLQDSGDSTNVWRLALPE